MLDFVDKISLLHYIVDKISLLNYIVDSFHVYVTMVCYTNVMHQTVLWWNNWYSINYKLVLAFNVNNSCSSYASYFIWNVMNDGVSKYSFTYAYDLGHIMVYSDKPDHLLLFGDNSSLILVLVGNLDHWGRDWWRFNHLRLDWFCCAYFLTLFCVMLEGCG